MFVHCFTDVPIEMARAFAIYDSTMPIIGLNDDDRQPAKSFSMIHELVHIFKRESSLCNDMRSLRKEEAFCNAVAGEVLVPRDALSAIIREQWIQRLGNFVPQDALSNRNVAIKLGNHKISSVYPV